MTRMTCNAARLLVFFSIAAARTTVAVELPHAEPRAVGMDAAKLAEVDAAVQEALDAGKMPGCVVLIARHGKTALVKAYGYRSLEPTKTPMTVDTVFDLASLTKPIATATSVMLLVEQGKLSID